MLLFSVGYLLLTTKDAKTLSVISPLASPIQATYASIKETFAPNLNDVVKDALRDADGEYAIVIKNIRTGETYMQNENESFASASLYKLWLMGTAYTQFAEGTLRPTDYMTNNVNSLNTMFSIASESAERSGGNVAMTATNAIFNAITVSDNYSALLLTSRVTIKAMAKFLSDTGMTHSTEDLVPQTSASDIALLYEKMYHHLLVSSHASEEMLQILKHQQINDRIPKYLPPSVETAHKTGELDGYKHDAGIVFTPQGDYIFVVLTKSDNPAIAAERIAVLSQRVYSYFQQ